MTPDRHVVLVPGFVGFDALGSLRYYAGVTKLFQGWKLGHGGDLGDVSLHYFDNFPTASVANRAARLKLFLAKKFARGQISVGDEITLIGHSTGGLDIRKLLLLLDAEPATQVDGHVPVSNAVLRQMIRRVVFLSVPHYGTNIADYVQSLRGATKQLLESLRDDLRGGTGFIAALRASLVDPSTPLQADMLRAIADTLAETHGFETAAREARFQLLLWLDHMVHDFNAIDDLSVPRWLASASSRAHDEDQSESPAHFDAARREAELGAWGDLTLRSYVTTVRREEAESARWLAWLQQRAEGIQEVLSIGASGALSLSRMLGFRWMAWPAIAAGVALINRRPSLLFDVAHAVCGRRGAAFRSPADVGDATFFVPPSSWQVDFGESAAQGQPRALRADDNDGIVNSLSMCWPAPQEGMPWRHEMFLVEADHGDVTGHHTLVPRNPDAKSTRGHGAYDFFEADTGFRGPQFERLWHHVFEFAFQLAPQELHPSPDGASLEPGRR